MPGHVPLNNAKFENTPDFNNQAIAGITGLGVFRQFEYSNITGTSRTLVNGDLWKMLQFTGNCLITIPAGLSANVGDEILLVNTTGTTSFTTSGGASLLSSTLYTVPAARPSRLVYAGSNAWLLAGAKTQYSSSSVYDCCGDPKPSLWTIGGSWPGGVAYSNLYGTGLYTYTGIGGVAVVDSIAYTIQNGVADVNECTLTNFDLGYTLYDEFSSPLSVYTYASIDILNDSEILGVAFKTSAETSVYVCDTTNAVNDGTWYRSTDIYGPLYPICLSGGIVTSTTAC